VQAPKVQQTKEAKALAAANSSKGKKKVRSWSLTSPKVVQTYVQGASPQT